MTKVSTPCAVRPSSSVPDQVSRTTSPSHGDGFLPCREPGKVGEERLEEGAAALVTDVYLVGLHEQRIGCVVGGDGIEVAGLDRVPMSLEYRFGVRHEFTLRVSQVVLTLRHPGHGKRARPAVPGTAGRRYPTTPPACVATTRPAAR